MQRRAWGCLIRVRLIDGGMDALVTLGAGDMRRTLNILQARCACMLSPAAWQSTAELSAFPCSCMAWTQALLNCIAYPRWMFNWGKLCMWLRMQATAMSAGEISEAAVYACTGNPLPADIAAAVQQLFNDDFRSVFASLADMQVAKGLALTDIVQQLHPCACTLTRHSKNASCPVWMIGCQAGTAGINLQAINIACSHRRDSADFMRQCYACRWLFTISMPEAVRIACVEALADVENRLAFGTSERLQLGALLGCPVLSDDLG